MYMPSAAPLPQHSTDPPTPEQALGRNLSLKRTDDAIRRAKAAFNCSANLSAQMRQDLPKTGGDVLYPMLRPDTKPLAQLATVESPADGSIQTDLAALAFGTLSLDQQMEIANAPRPVKEEFSPICDERPPDRVEGTYSAAPWGNATAMFPEPRLKVEAGVRKFAADHPILFLLLLGAGVYTLNSAMDGKR